MPAAAPSLGCAGDRATATAASFALPPVNIESLGEIAQFPIGPGIVTQGGPASLDGRRQQARELERTQLQPVAERLERLASADGLVRI